MRCYQHTMTDRALITDNFAMETVGEYINKHKNEQRALKIWQVLHSFIPEVKISNRYQLFGGTHCMNEWKNMDNIRYLYVGIFAVLTRSFSSLKIMQRFAGTRKIIIADRRCGPVPIVPNALPSGLLTDVGAQVKYECQTGFHKSGSQDRTTCLDSLTWEKVNISCEGN